MSEIAFISVRKSYLSDEIKKGSKSAKTALRLANKPDNFLSTIQIGITIIGILTGIYSGNVLAGGLSKLLTESGISSSVSYSLAQTIIVVIVTYFSLIFGELVPKRIGMSAAEKTVKTVARPMYLLSLIASPFVWLLAKSTAFVFNFIGLKTDESKVTEDEIKSLIEEGTKDGEIQEVEQDIVERVFLLGDLKVSSLMTHRSDIIFLDININKAEIRNVLEHDLYEMYPVVDRNLDNIKGIVTLKDLILKLDSDDFTLHTIYTPAVFFHENMSVYKVLELMRSRKINQVLICDEFGSCQGLLTLKDILVGLIGVIEDANEEPDIIKRKDGEGWLIDGQCPLYDFLSYFDMEQLYSNNNDFNTVGGLILKNLEHIPQSGESIQWEQFHFEVVDMDGARIDKILVTIQNNNC
jgi:putative hemolysin